MGGSSFQSDGGVVSRAGVRRPRVWIHIHEIPDGNWGAAGQVIMFAQLRLLATPGSVSVAGDPADQQL